MKPYTNRRGRGLPPRLTGHEPRGSAGVACPDCGGQGSNVLDSRPTEGVIRRVRCCRACGLRFATIERVEGVTPTRQAFTLVSLRRLLNAAVARIDELEGSS